jgi:hypothetical protein
MQEAMKKPRKMEMVEITIKIETSSGEKSRHNIDGSAMFYHKKIDLLINGRFPFGGKVTQDVTPEPPTTTPVVAIPTQANSSQHSNRWYSVQNLTKDEITKMIKKKDYG